MKQVFYLQRQNLKRLIRSNQALGSILSTLLRSESIEIANAFGIDITDLRAPLDAEEMSRITIEDEYTLIIVDVPITEERNNQTYYVTIPLGLSSRKKLLSPPVWRNYLFWISSSTERLRNFYTFMRSRFIFQILYHNAELYLDSPSFH